LSKIVDIQDLVLRFYTYEGVVKALEGVNLYIKEGETLGLVGETGCGKTMTGLSIFNLIPSPGNIEGGKIFFKSSDGKTIDLLSQKEEFLTKVRGEEASMIFQEPSFALNPTMTVGDQVSEVLLKHKKDLAVKKTLEALKKTNTFEGKMLKKMLEAPDSLLLKLTSKIPFLNSYKNKLKEQLRKEVVSLFRKLQIADPERIVGAYPHELSGGMQQRVVIAIALACVPLLLVADEPTTSLDVTVQARILELIRELKKEFGSSVLFITHDLGVIAEMCDRVAVMYAGNICEIADINETFKKPLHPYTQALLKSIPQPGKKFQSIRGFVPNLINPPSGCRFHPRCSYAMEICSKIKPKSIEISKHHFIACHLYTGSSKK
jgi:peptide/nickel transport system ATP-binding protein